MNKRELGERYRNVALLFLAATGYATTRQIAKALHGRVTLSTRKMTSRTLQKLQADKLIVSKRESDAVNNVNSELLFALTKAGAEKARGQGSSLVGGKIHGRDYLRHAHKHRTMCNSVYVAWPTNGWSELQIRAEDAPIQRIRFRGQQGEESKIPDLLMESKEGGYEWVEVENSWRSEKDLQKVIDFMRAIFVKPSAIQRVHFVVTSAGARSIGSRLRQKLTHGLNSGYPLQVRNLDAKLLAEHISVSALDTETLELTAIHF